MTVPKSWSTRERDPVRHTAEGADRILKKELNSLLCQKTRSGSDSEVTFRKVCGMQLGKPVRVGHRE